MTSLPIIDADGHVVEPDATFTSHLDPRYASYAPRVIDYGDHFRYACGDRLGFRIYAKPETVGAPGQTAHRTDAPIVARGADDPAGRLADLDVEGIDRAVLYPTYGLMIKASPSAIRGCALPCRQRLARRILSPRPATADRRRHLADDPPDSALTGAPLHRTARLPRRVARPERFEGIRAPTRARRALLVPRARTCRSASTPGSTAWCRTALRRSLRRRLHRDARRALIGR
jgi:hypothetical protein